MYTYLRTCANITPLMRKSFSFNNILSLLYRRFKPEALDKMKLMNKTEPEMISCMLNIYIKIHTS